MMSSPSSSSSSFCAGLPTVVVALIPISARASSRVSLLHSSIIGFQTLIFLGEYLMSLFVFLMFRMGWIICW